MKGITQGLELAQRGEAREAEERGPKTSSDGPPRSLDVRACAPAAAKDGRDKGARTEEGSRCAQETKGGQEGSVERFEACSADVSEAVPDHEKVLV